MTATIGQLFYLASFDSETGKIDVFTKVVRDVRRDGKVTFQRKDLTDRREWLDVVPSYYFPTPVDAVKNLQVSLAKDVARQELKLSKMRAELRTVDAVVSQGTAAFLDTHAGSAVQIVGSR